MGFALRYSDRDYPLPEGRFLIGRSEDCQLCLADPMASRSHAVIIVGGGVLKLEDLGSRNGVVLNRTKIAEPTLLKHGDVIRIGAQEILVVQRRLSGAKTLAQGATEVGVDKFGLLGGLAEKALALGHGDEAERILGRQLDHLLERAESADAEVQLDADEFEKASAYAFRILSITCKGKWLDYLFRLHATEARLLDSEMVNELYSLCPRVTGASRAQLRAYLRALEDEAANYAPGQRFVLNRLEGLEKQL